MSAREATGPSLPSSESGGKMDLVFQLNQEYPKLVEVRFNASFFLAA
jgi:hypothetical protein